MLKNEITMAWVALTGFMCALDVSLIDGFHVLIHFRIRLLSPRPECIYVHFGIDPTKHVTSASEQIFFIDSRPHGIV